MLRLYYSDSCYWYVYTLNICVKLFLVGVNLHVEIFKNEKIFKIVIIRNLYIIKYASIHDIKFNLTNLMLLSMLLKDNCYLYRKLITIQQLS